MAIIKASAKIERKKNKNAIRKLKAFDKQAASKPAVKVGYPIGKRGSIKYPLTGTPVASVAFWNEFGTLNPNGSVHSPERPFFRPAINENRKKYQGVLKAWAKKAVKGSSLKKGVRLVGAAAVSDIQNKINDVSDPPNAPATIKRKYGTNNPLVNTSFLKGSTTYAVISLEKIKK